ncbi:DUF1858 domain-containing protein [Desulfitobacterium sp. Sab5]|uniref:DUF1858 domain-containing protein n=1 Tax=Desulfitobacterium nosdiversum TaxID=3375356 RepID=UPI003CEE7114
MGNVIDLSKSVYEICIENPEVIDIMKDLGFEDIAKPGMLKTAGRFMTLPKGAALKKISFDKLKEILVNKGYQLIDQ